MTESGLILSQTWANGRIRTPAPGLPIVCGHRGAPAVAPENTIEGFAAAVRQGATWIEFDVRPAADAFVVHHDPATTDGLSIAVAASEDLANREIPTLAELLDWNAALDDPLGLDVELKGDEVGVDVDTYVAQVLDALAGAGPAEVIVTSFDVELLRAFRLAAPEVPTGLLFYDRSADWAIDTAQAHGHHAIAPAHRLVTPEVVAAAHGRGLGVMTWTCNEPEDIDRVIAAGVDMVIGDSPAAIVAAIERRDAR